MRYRALALLIAVGLSDNRRRRPRANQYRGLDLYRGRECRSTGGSAASVLMAWQQLLWRRSSICARHSPRRAVHVRVYHYASDEHIENGPSCRAIYSDP
jgi:hypothetical protein